MARSARRARSSAPWCTRCWRPPTRSPPTSPPNCRPRSAKHSVWWPVDVPAADLAAALVPMHDTPLGPLADNLTLRQIGLQDRLREMDFEFPLAGGDLRDAASPTSGSPTSGGCSAEHLPADDPLAGYVDRLTDAALGRQSLRGYLSGSVDVVLRIPAGAGHRYVVVDYKTNWLGEPDGAADRRRLQPRPHGRGDAALRLSAAGAAVLRCAASVPALAAARLRPGPASGRGAVPVRARHVRPGHPGDRRASRPGCSAGSRRPRWWSRCRICSTAGRWRHDGPGRPTSTIGAAASRPPDCCASSTTLA